MKDSPAQPKVGVAILAYNKTEVVKSCILSVRESSYANYIIVVVDNASRDNVSRIIEYDYPSVRIIRSEENLGYTGGNNLALKYAIEKEECGYVLILNDDATIDSNLVNELVGVAERDSKIGIANPQIVYFEEPDKLCQPYGKYNFYLGIPYQSLVDRNEPETIGLVRGTCFLIKKEAIEKIGLMDEDFFLYFDEADLSYRVRKAGYKIVYVPSVKAYHKISHSFSGTATPAVLYYTTRNELLFARKHLNLIVFFPPWTFRFIFRIIKYTVKTRDLHTTSAILAGFTDFAKGKYGKWESLEEQGQKG